MSFLQLRLRKVFFFLIVCSKGRETERERERPFTDSFPKCLEWRDLDLEAEAKNGEHNPGFPGGDRNLIT